jgi:hypothetical protein
MKKSLPVVAALAFALTTGTGARAQNQDAEQANPETASRYQLRKHEEGYLRIDTQTGAMSLCKVEDVGLVCRLGAREREAYETALDTMQQQLDDLRDRVDILETHAALVDRSEDQPEPDAEVGTSEEDSEDEEIIPGSELTKREIDRAIELTRKMMRPLFDAVQDLRKELEKEEPAQ